MSVFDCLDQAHPSPQELLIADGLFNTAMFALLLATFVIALASPLVRRAYRNRVTRLMGLNQVRPRPSSWWQANEVTPRRSAAVSESGTKSLSADGLFANARSWENRITLASVAAWLAFSLTGYFIAAWTDPSDGWLYQVEFVFGAGLFGLGPLVVNLPVRWKRKVLVMGLVIAAVAGGVLEWINFHDPVSSNESPGDDWPSWLQGIFTASFFGVYMTLFHRRLRGLVIPLSLVLAVLTLSVIIPYAYIEPRIGSCLWDLDAQTPVLNDAASRQFWGLASSFIVVSLVALGLWLGLWAIGILARLVERGWLGDLSMVSVIGLGMISYMLIFSNLPEDSASYSLWVTWLPLAWLAAPFAVYIVVLGRRKATGDGLGLLMLRVFSRHSRDQDFLDQVQSRWRYIGAVQQAGGPDLVDVNVSPYECAMFLSSRLHDLYLPAAVSEDQLRRRFNYLPDREGRYRINEMFNFNTAWRNNVEQLILMSKTILLDLRGLTAEREGTSYEVGLLARHGLLHRVVAIGDDTTDWAHVDRQLHSASASLEQLKRVDIKSSQDQDELIAELLKVAVRQTSAPAEQPDGLSHDDTV